jgi:hypothetical protein
MISVLNIENAKKLLSENASGMPIPWALIKEAFFAFTEHLYSQNILLAHALDSDTANWVQPILGAKQLLSLNVNGDEVVIAHLDNAKTLISQQGTLKLGAQWNTVSPHVMTFLAYLYSHNIFIAQAEGMASAFLAEKLKDGRNLSIRVKKGENQNG